MCTTLIRGPVLREGGDWKWISARTRASRDWCCGHQSRASGGEWATQAGPSVWEGEGSGV